MKKQKLGLNDLSKFTNINSLQEKEIVKDSCTSYIKYDNRTKVGAYYCGLVYAAKVVKTENDRVTFEPSIPVIGNWCFLSNEKLSFISEDEAIKIMESVESTRKLASELRASSALRNGMDGSGGQLVERPLPENPEGFGAHRKWFMERD